MWQNNGFGNLNGSGNSGSLQPSTYNQELNFNDPDSYNPFPGTGPAFGNQFFNSQQRLNNNTMGMGLGMDMQFIKGAEQEEYQPEVGLFADATISPFTNGRTQQVSFWVNFQQIYLSSRSWYRTLLALPFCTFNFHYFSFGSFTDNS